MLAHNLPWRLPGKCVLFLGAIPGTLLRRRCSLGKSLLELLRKMWHMEQQPQNDQATARRGERSQVPVNLGDWFSLVPPWPSAVPLRPEAASGLLGREPHHQPFRKTLVLGRDPETPRASCVSASIIPVSLSGPLKAWTPSRARPALTLWKQDRGACDFMTAYSLETQQWKKVFPGAGGSRWRR